MIIVIDDERTFALEKPELPGYVEVKYARTSDEGLAVLAKAWTDYILRYGNMILRYGNMVDIYLDHDLGEGDTIMPVVDFLYVIGKTAARNRPLVYSFPDVVSNIFVHSQNPTAGDTIIPLLSPLYKNVQRISLPELL